MGSAANSTPSGFEEHGLQCGYCTPGMMLALEGPLERNPDPTEDDVRWALSGNLCRCTGYQNIVKSVLWAARENACRSRRGCVMALDELKIGGMGASRRRVEDNRFIRGKGNYVDDVVLPAMLHMEVLRSPLAHARIKSIDTSAAWEVPGVRLVLTGETMAARNLAWMPTLSYDTQPSSRPTRCASRPRGRCGCRRRSVHRQGCLQQDSRGIRAAPGDRQPRSGEGLECAADPGRQGQSGLQQDLRLGDRG